MYILEESSGWRALDSHYGRSAIDEPVFDVSPYEDLGDDDNWVPSVEGCQPRKNLN